MVAKALIKKSWDYFTKKTLPSGATQFTSRSNKELLGDLKLLREFANRSQKKFGNKTQTLTSKGKLLYEGIPKPLGSTIMSHGRMRSHAMIKALQGRAPLGQKLRLSDYKKGVKPKKKKGTKPQGKIPGAQPRRIFRTPWEKADFEAGNVLKAQKRLNEIRYKQSGSYRN